VLLDCVIYCAFYSILFRGAVFFPVTVYIHTWSLAGKFSLVPILDFGMTQGGCELVKWCSLFGTENKYTSVFHIFLHKNTVKIL